MIFRNYYVMLCHTFHCMSNFIILFKYNITFIINIQNILEIIEMLNMSQTCYKFINLIQLCADLLIK
jgi:hypothetical protein